MKKTKRLLSVRILVFGILLVYIYTWISRIAQPDWFASITLSAACHL